MTGQSTAAAKPAPFSGTDVNARIAVIGGGVIGASWTALFLANGRQVRLYDTASDAEARIRKSLVEILPRLTALGYPSAISTDRLQFCPDLASAVHDADIVQENGPERVAFKRKLWKEAEEHARPDALFLSSSSGITATIQAAGLRNPSRLLVGHPFNPPHLLPLVEVAPGKRTSPEAVAAAVAFFKSIGKHPVVLRKEVIGFVANRLQAALLRESISLVKSGVVDVEEVDDIVANSIGLRWAVGGPFISSHLGGGPTGMTGYLKQFARGLQLLWLQFQVTPVILSGSVKQKLLDQIASHYGRTPIPELEAQRDVSQIAVIHALQASGPTAQV